MEVAMLTASAAVTPTDVSISNTRRFEFASTINAHRYVISIGLPDERCPERGCGVLYVLDGDFYFASAAGAARLGNAPGIVVVGIGYPNRPAFVKSVLSEHQPLPAYFNSMPPSQAAIELERTYDLTLPATDGELVAQRDITVSEMTSKSVGGLDDFLKTIEIDVKPRVAKLVSIDPTNQAIFGHSLGGLAVLHALFVNPGGFRTFISASPSIWWNMSSVLLDEPRFSAAVQAGTVKPRVLLTIGSNESTAPTIIPPGWGMSAAELDTALQRARMVQNVAELAARLKALRGNEGYVVDYAVFDQQDHGISPWPAIGRGISFAFKRGL
jgi:predicted alpha/beta superfamily hydrolase